MSILLSVTSRSSIETHERIELVRIFPKIREHCSNVCAMYLANKLSSSETLSQTPDLDNFATVYRSLKRVISLAPQMDADSVINWTVVGLSWQYLRAPTLDGSLSQWSPSCVYSTFPSRGFISDSWYFHRTDSVETGGWLVAQPGGLRSEVLNDYALYKSTQSLTHSLTLMLGFALPLPLVGLSGRH